MYFLRSTVFVRAEFFSFAVCFAYYFAVFRGILWIVRNLCEQIGAFPEGINMRFRAGKYTQKRERGTDCFEKKSDRRKRRGVGERGA